MTQDAFETTNRRSMAIMDRLASNEGSASLYILWGFFAVAAVAAAIATSFTPGADRRIAAAMSTPSQASRVALPIEEHTQKAEYDDAERAALVARLKALEEQLGTLTGSVAAAKPRPTERGVTPAATDEAERRALEPEPVFAPAVEVPTLKTVRTTVIDPAGEDSSSANGSVTHTLFGIDLGTETSFGALRIRWDSLQRKYPELALLSPRISARDKNGRVELHLVAGPFDNAADAARVCAGLLAKGAFCDGSLFDGQRLPAT